MRRTSLFRSVALLALGAVAAVATFFATTGVSTGQRPLGPEPLTPAERAASFQPGPPWDGRGVGRWSQADLQAFADYPLLWPGEIVGGYHLQAVGRSRAAAPAGHRLHDMVTLIYGRCTPDGDEPRCPAPLTVHVVPACAVRPHDVAEAARAGLPQAVRGGARLQRLTDGSLLLWTGSVTVSITPMADPALGEQALQQLRGVGRLLASLRASDPLPAPDEPRC